MNYRVSGHESFTCRYTWLPKVVHYLQSNSRLFSDERRAMVELGVGKNMVRSIRFWAQSADIITTNGKPSEYQLTTFATSILGNKGLDQYLEDTRTLWLLHWKLATNVSAPLLAWDYLLNKWVEPEITISTVVKVLHKEALKTGEKLSATTVTQHCEAFVHTYFATRGRKGLAHEDSLDCPLVELTLIIKVGERERDQSNGRREAIYAFRREPKPEITPELFLYCLTSFWRERHPAEGVLSFREVAHGHGSPGQIFKLPEDDVRIRLERLEQFTGGMFTYLESSTLQQVRRTHFSDDQELLKRIYKPDARNH